MTTASDVINPKKRIAKALTIVATATAPAETVKNIAASVHHRCRPGRKTNLRFISQQKMLATTKPIAVASAKRNERTASVASTAGSEKNRTAQSSDFRQGKIVAADA